MKISDQENATLNKRVFTISKGKVKAKADAFSSTTDHAIAVLSHIEQI